MPAVRRAKNYLLFSANDRLIEGGDDGMEPDGAGEALDRRVRLA